MIRAAFPVDRRWNASMSAAATVSAASPTARNDQLCAPSCALVLPTETVRGSRCRRSGDASSSRRGASGFASCARELPSRSCPRSVVTGSGAAGPASACITVFRGDVIAGAVPPAVAGCTYGASSTLAATGVSATAGESAVVRGSVATSAGVWAAATGLAAGVASVTGGGASACADSAAGDEATCATGSDPAAVGATSGGSKVKGST
jgi:hypothetical protein